MNEETRNTLRRVVFTLEQIDVRGKGNLDHMLGAIMTLEQIINQPEEAKDDGE